MQNTRVSYTGAARCLLEKKSRPFVDGSFFCKVKVLTPHGVGILKLSGN